MPDALVSWTASLGIDLTRRPCCRLMMCFCVSLWIHVVCLCGFTLISNLQEQNDSVSAMGYSLMCMNEDLKQQKKIGPLDYPSVMLGLQCE